MPNFDESPPPTSTPDLLVAAATLVQDGREKHFALVPRGYSIVSTERALEAPSRGRRRVTLRTVSSFLEAFKTFVAAGSAWPAFYVNGRGNGLNVRLIFNSNSWADSYMALQLDVSAQFRRWLALEAAGLNNQKAFAQFIEDNLADVVEPQGAKLLEICRGFRATQTVRFASTVDLTNGDVGLEYIQETKAGTVDAKSRLQVPETITLGLPLYEGEERIKIKARFRYEIDDGRLRLGVKFPQLEAAFEAASADLIARLRKALPTVTFMEGAQEPVSPIEFANLR